MGKKDSLDGIAKTEGASTGQPTNLKSTALGKYQMIESTRKAMYKKLGYTDMEGAEKEFKRNPTFEKKVADMYKDELNAKIPKSIQGVQRERMLAKGWYTGDVNYPDDKVPNPEAGNTLTAGQYASKSTGTQITSKTSVNIPYKNSVPDTSPWVPKTDPIKRNSMSMTSLDGSYKPSITGKTIIPEEATTLMDTREPSSKQKINWKGTASAVTPYLSNIYNTFQKPAAIPQPVYNKPVQLERVNMDNDRYEANRDYRTDIANADRTLDGNTSVAVKQFAKAQKFGNMSKINQEERNQNIAISNKEVGINAGIQQGNNEMLYNFRTLGAERENAIKTQRSANLANAADKFTAQQNVKAQYDLEDRKLGVLENTDEYGTYGRLSKKLGLDKKRMGGSLGKYSAGAFMKKLKTVY
jgi:hypothetical protein